MENKKSMAPVAILKTYFGLLPGQSLVDFIREVKALNTDERAELVNLAATQLNITVETVA